MPRAWAWLLMWAETPGTLVVYGLIEGTLAIQEHSHQDHLPVGPFTHPSALANWACSQIWPVGWGKSRGERKWLPHDSHWCAEIGTWGACASPPSRRQASIGINGALRAAMLIERDGGDALPVSHRLIDIPVVVGSISRHIGRELVGEAPTVRCERGR